METKRKCGCRSKKAAADDVASAAETYAGVAIDKADDNKVDPKLVKERTSTLNNNPRNQGE